MPRLPSFFSFKQPRPRIGYQICSRGAGRFPILRLVDQLCLNGILLDVISDISELARGSDAGFIIAVLPTAAVENQMRAGLGRDMAHERMHESWQRPRLTKREQGMPVARHDNKRAEMNALMTKRYSKESTINCRSWELRSGFFGRRDLVTKKVAGASDRRCNLKSREWGFSFIGRVGAQRPSHIGKCDHLHHRPKTPDHFLQAFADLA